MLRAVLLATGLILSAPVFSSIPDWLIPTPVTIVLHLGKWMLSEDIDEEVYYIRVQSSGSTESEARKEAFRLAVDQAVGSLLVSETSIQDNTLQSHSVINYSSGYIHDFEYVNIHRGTEVVLQVDVWVKKSKIAERISLNKSAEGDLQGGRIAQAFKSLQQQKQTSDQLLQTVLDDFPHGAYESHIDSLEYVFEGRTPYLYVHFTTWWSKSYVESLREVLENIGESAGRYDNNFSVGFIKENCVFCSMPKYLIEPQQANHMFMSFVSPSPVVHAQLLDTSGKIVHQGCVNFGSLSGDTQDAIWQGNGVGVNLYPDRANQEVIRYNLTGIDVEKLDTVKLSFTTQNLCKN